MNITLSVTGLIENWLHGLRPKLKFYLFPLTLPTLKKGPTQKNYSNFSQEYFF